MTKPKPARKPRLRKCAVAGCDFLAQSGKNVCSGHNSAFLRKPRPAAKPILRELLKEPARE